MGKTGGSSSWLTALKRAFISPTKHKKRITRGRDNTSHPGEESPDKGRGKKRLALPKEPAGTKPTASHSQVTIVNRAEAMAKAGSDAIAVAMATTAAAEAAVAAAKAALDTLRGKPSNSATIRILEQRSAVIIQRIFRGYLARKALRALRGLVCLQALIRGHNVRKKVETTLRCVQALVRVQDQVCDQRRKQLCHENSINSFVSRSIELIRNSIPEYWNGEAREQDYCEKDTNAVRLENKREVALNSETSLASAFSQQIWSEDEHPEDQLILRKPRDRLRRISFDQKEPIKTIEVDTYGPYSASYGRIISPRMSLQANLYSPRCPRNHPHAPTSQNPLPSYMCATESTRARLRSQSTPKLRALTPRKQFSSLDSLPLYSSDKDPKKLSGTKDLSCCSSEDFRAPPY